MKFKKFRRISLLPLGAINVAATPIYIPNYFLEPHNDAERHMNMVLSRPRIQEHNRSGSGCAQSNSYGRLTRWCLALALAFVFLLPPADTLASPLRLADRTIMPSGQP